MRQSGTGLLPLALDVARSWRRIAEMALVLDLDAHVVRVFNAPGGDAPH